MQNIQPVNINTATEAKDLLESIKSQMGVVPNIFATMAHSASALQGYLAFSEALGSGHLNQALREQIALTVGGENQCDYCASAHSFLAKHAGIDAAEINLNLNGKSQNQQTAVILKFVKEVVENRGVVDPSAIESLRSIGVTDAELVEIIAHIGLNIFTNYFNHLAGTAIDFPVVNTQAA